MLSHMNAEEAYQIIDEGHPRLRFCERFDDASTLWNYARHSHPYIELMYFIEGRGDITVSDTAPVVTDTKLTISLFDTVVYPANWAHQEEAVPERRREIICLWVELPALVVGAPIQVQDKDGELRGIFEYLHREAKREQPRADLLEYGLKILLIHILRLNEQAREGGHLTVVLQYMQTRYGERTSLDELAGLVHISKSYLSRLFKREMGMTVVEYMNRLRVSAAKRLLVSTNLGVNEIAYQVGYESPKYFFRTFKAVTGESPVHFRKRNESKREQGASPDAF